MPPKSLMELAIMACLKNIREIDDIGFLTYESVREILLKIDSAAQLRQIELNSAHIVGQTGEIWLKIIEKDFPMEYKANLYKPLDPKKWYKVWEKYKKEHDDALKESENKLKMALAGLRHDKEKNTSKIVGNKNLPSALRMGPKRNYYGGPREGSSSVMTFGGGSRTKTSNGASVMRKVRREVKEIANIHGSLSRPIKAPSRPVMITRAPEAMLNDSRRAAQPIYRSVQKEATLPSALQEHEQRATYLSDSEEDDHTTFLDSTFKSQRALDDSTRTQATKFLAKPTQRSPSSSLMKKFGASGKSPVKKTSPAVTSTTAKKLPGTLSNGNPTDAKAQMKDLGSATPVKCSTKSPEKLAAANIGATLFPPPGLTLSLSSSEEPSSSQLVEGQRAVLIDTQDPTNSVVAPRKRKAVSVFMQPKRRAMS